MSFSLTLAVADLQHTAFFYREVLGLTTELFRPLPTGATVLLLHQGDATLLFRETAAMEALHPALFQNLERHPRGVGITLEYTVADLQPVRQAINRHRLHSVYELDDAEFGRRELWLHDPDGYLIVLNQET